MGDKIKSIAKQLGLLLVTIVLGVWAIFYLVGLSERTNTADLPQNETPPVVDELPVVTPPEIKTSFVDLITPADNYKVTGNPYSPESYKKLSRALALMGNFEVAKLQIKGVLENDTEHFLSINIGTESGVYNAVRKSPDGLDILLTKENGGVFDKENPIDVEIDLLGQQTLSTTKAEFLATRKTTKLVKFWDFIRPQPPAPSVNRILVASFDKNGFYAGTIGLVRFEYRCEADSRCSVALCGNDILTTKCLLDKFGKEAKDIWVKWYEQTTN